jgi:short-subunit dehydrogenase
VPGLNEVVKNISDTQGKMDGLIAAAGIQQETSALEYTAKDANTMFEVRRVARVTCDRWKLTIEPRSTSPVCS